MLTNDQRYNDLARPFASDAIEWRIMVNPREGKTMAHVAPYITARAVMNRLDEAAAFDWATEFGPLEVFQTQGVLAVRCTLTVGGVHRSDYGSIRLSDDERAAEAPKGAASIALRRAAVQFGIGRYLYRWPKTFATVKPLGHSFVLLDEAEDELLMLAERLSSDKPLPRFRHVFVPGYAPHMQDLASPPQVAPAPRPTTSAAPASGPKPVTDSQKVFIGRLVHRAQQGDATKLRALSTRFAVDLLAQPLDLEGLTAHHASALIEALQPQKTA